MFRILVAHEDKVLRVFIKHFLIFQGFEVETASDGWDALLGLCRSKYDLLMLDAGLTLVTVQQICEIVKEHEETREIPILLLAASPNTSCLATCVPCPPFPLTGLLHAVATTLLGAMQAAIPQLG
jgi:DNA-binding response OmpR family regulator